MIKQEVTSKELLYVGKIVAASELLHCVVVSAVSVAAHPGKAISIKSRKSVLWKMDHEKPMNRGGIRNFDQSNQNQEGSRPSIPIPWVPVDQIDQADPSNAKQMNVTTSSYAAHSFDDSFRGDFPGSLIDLEICKPWLQAVAMMDQLREDNGFFCGWDSTTILKKENHLYTLIEELFTSEQKRLTRISMFTTLFLFLPTTPIVPDIDSSLCCMLPNLPLFINILPSSTTIQITQRSKAIINCIELLNISAREKLDVMILVLPYLQLSNFIVTRPDDVPKEKSREHRLIRNEGLDTFTTCSKILTECVRDTISASEVYAASFLVHFHFTLAVYQSGGSENFSESHKKLITAINAAFFLENQKKVAKLVAYKLPLLYEQDFKFCFFDFVETCKSDYFAAKIQLGQTTPLTFKQLRYWCRTSSAKTILR